MYEDNKGFKTTLMGGFNREDVLRYIEQSAKENGDKIEKLQQENDALIDERNGLRESNETLSQRNADLLERLGEMTLLEEQKSKDAEILIARAARDAEELRTLRERLALLSEENDAAKQKMEHLTVQVAEYEAAKENIADMELCAHRRAKDLEARAEFEARRVRMQSAEVVSALKKEIANVCEEYQSATAQAQKAATENDRRAATVQRKLEQVLESLDAVVVGELAADQAEGQERPRVQRVLDILCGRDGD